jgi:hypothetical protein
MISDGTPPRKVPDISHGEANLAAEWGIVRLGLLVLFFLIVATFICTGLVSKYFSHRSDEERRKPGQ